MYLYVNNLSIVERSFRAETHIKRQEAQHDCLPSLGTKELCTVKKNMFCTGPTKAAKAEQKSLVPSGQANGPTKE
jgi:hypothetical protein